MCGLAGVLGRRTQSWVAPVLGALRDRGRDGGGSVLLDEVSLAACRFSTIDVESAAQPMWSSDSRYLIAANCEIFNFRSLRRRLEAHGHSAFKTHGDVEVALASYVEYGLEAFRLFRGPFAIAIWDSHESELVLARDRLGERPLFTSTSQGELHFASSMRGLGAMGVPMDLDSRKAVEFLVLGTDSWHSVAAGVDQVRPGTVEIHSQQATTSYTFAGPESLDDAPDDDERMRAFDIALERVRVSDFEVGVAFSGGVDSTAVLAGLLGQGVSPEAITLLSGSADGTRERARRSAAYLGLSNCEEYYTLPSAREAFEIAARRVDTPADSPILLHNDALHLRASSRHRVLVAGHGADEILPGYTRYRTVLKDSRKPDAECLTGKYDRWSLALSSGPALAAHGLEPKLVDDVANRVRERYEDCLRRARGCAGTAAQLIDLEIFDWWELFALPDQNALWHELEVRSPFYDSDLVASILGSSSKSHLHEESKQLLRRWSRRRLPEDLFHGSKLGFDSGFGYDRWLSDNAADLTELVDDVVANLVDLSTVERGETPLERTLLWRAVALSAWRRRMVTDGSKRR